MARYDIFGRTEGMRRQVQDLILTAYRKGYKDGELDEQDRKLEMLLKEKKGKWIDGNKGKWNAVYCPKCSVCGTPFYGIETARYHYCPNCGAEMEEDNGHD